MKKTCSLDNPFFDKNILIDNEKENETEKNILEEFRNSGLQRKNIEKKSSQIDKETNSVMNEIKNIDISNKK